MEYIEDGISSSKSELTSINADIGTINTTLSDKVDSSTLDDKIGKSDIDAINRDTAYYGIGGDSPGTLIKALAQKFKTTTADVEQGKTAFNQLVDAGALTESGSESNNGLKGLLSTIGGSIT